MRNDNGLANPPVVVCELPGVPADHIDDVKEMFADEPEYFVDTITQLIRV